LYGFRAGTGGRARSFCDPPEVRVANLAIRGMRGIAKTD
jgi:hypothetical protein